VVALAGWRLSRRLRSGGAGAPAAGPGVLLGLAEGASYSSIALGLAVLVIQVRVHILSAKP